MKIIKLKDEDYNRILFSLETAIIHSENNLTSCKECKREDLVTYWQNEIDEIRKVKFALRNGLMPGIERNMNI